MASSSQTLAYTEVCFSWCTFFWTNKQRTYRTARWMALSLSLHWELLAKPSGSFCCQTNLITGQMEIRLNNCLDIWLSEIESLKHLSSTISLFPSCCQAPLNNDTMKIWCPLATGILEMLLTLQTPLDSTAELQSSKHEIPHEEASRSWEKESKCDVLYFISPSGQFSSFAQVSTVSTAASRSSLHRC